MHPTTAKFFANAAQEYRDMGDERMAGIMEASLSFNLEAEFQGGVLEAEFERELREHHRRLRESEGDPFKTGGAS